MKKKICFVVSNPYTAKFVKNHVKKLSVEHELYLVANFDVNDENILSLLETFDFHDYKVVPINRAINIFYDLLSVYKLYRYFKIMRFDVIHSITPKAGLISALAGKLASIKNRIHIYTGQVWATKEGVFKFTLKQIDKVIANLCTQILIDGNSQRDFLVAEKVLNKNQGKVLGAGSICGANLEQFTPNIEMRHTIRKELNLSDDTVVYLFLGRINIDKGVKELARAFNKLSSENKNVFLLLIGYDEDNLLDYIQNTIVNKDSYHYFGQTESPEMYYQASDVFCLPSYREGFGMSVIEASACGIPVICSDAYGLMDTIVDNKTGLRHKVKDADSLYRQMNKLSNDKKLRDSLGQNGLKYIKDNFAADIISNAWIEFYKGLV